MSLKSKLKSAVDKAVRKIAEPAVARYLENTVAPQLIELLARPTRQWKHKPRFAAFVQRGPDGIVLRVFTDSAIYMWVTKGTSKHIIRPNPGRRLRRGMRRPWEKMRNRKLVIRFPEPYFASTRPGSLQSERPRRGGQYMFAPATVVAIRPRRFGETAVNELRGKIRSQLPGLVRVQLEAIGMKVEAVSWK